MPLYRVHQVNRVEIETQFLIRADSRDEAETLARSRDDPDSATIDYDTMAFVRHRMTEDIDFAAEDRDAVNLDLSAPSDEDEDDYDPYDEDEYPDDEEDDEDEEMLVANAVALATTLPPEALNLIREELEQSGTSEVRPAPLQPVIAEAAGNDEEEEAEESTAENKLDEQFGEDDANWTHDVVFSLGELADDTRAVFNQIVVDGKLLEYYDVIWAGNNADEGHHLLWNYLSEVFFQEGPRAASQLERWTIHQDRRLRAIVSAIAVGGRETVTCCDCGLRVPKRTAQLVGVDYVGRQCNCFLMRTLAQLPTLQMTV